MPRYKSHFHDLSDFTRKHQNWTKFKIWSKGII